MCGSVGGDFYDFIRANDDQIVVLIGDVVGHGVRASLVMAQIMGYLRTRPPALTRPREIMTTLNDLLIDLGERVGSVLPCSMFYAVIDSPTGVSFFVNSGHPNPLLCQNGRCRYLTHGPRNLLLGVQDYEPDEGCHTFEPGQRLVLYTDGLTEAADNDGSLFGQERLEQAIRAALQVGPAECADRVFQAVEDFRAGGAQTDDESIVIIDRV